MTFQLPDPSTPFGERVARRLREERLIWLTTVDARGQLAVQPALRLVPRFMMVNSLRMNTRVVTTDYKQLIRESVLNDEGFIKATFSGQHRDRTVGAGNVGARVVRCGGVGPCGC